MSLNKTIAILAFASSTLVEAQWLKPPSDIDELWLKVSGNVEFLITQPNIDTSSSLWYNLKWDQDVRWDQDVKSNDDIVKQNLAWFQKWNHDPCRNIEKALIENINCKLSQWGFSNTQAWRDSSDWRMRQSQVELINKFAKSIFGNLVSVTEWTRIETSKVVFLQNYRIRGKMVLYNGRLRPNIEFGYYNTF
jgi:hypothetical protein